MIGALQALAFLFLQLLDYKTTTFGIDNGAYEINGLVRLIIEHYGYTGFLVMKVMLAGLFTVLLWRAPKAALVAIVFYAGAALWNLYQIAGLPAF